MTVIADGVEQIKALAGTDLGRSPWLEITQQRVDDFADAADDHQWIHVDPVRAANGPFHGTIAHGYLTLALVIPMFTELLEVRGMSMSVNYGLDRVRFPAPVRVGSKIRLAARVDQVEEFPNGVQMTLDFTVEIDGTGKPACVARPIYRHYL